MAKEVLDGKDRSSLEQAIQSDAGRKLAAGIDGSKLENAAREGDMKVLSAMLRDILATPEGKSFAAEIRKAVGKDGR